MTSEQLRQWRKTLRLSQAAAARELGISPRMLAYYERGERDGQPVVIPRTVALACAARAHGLQPHGS